MKTLKYGLFLFTISLLFSRLTLAQNTTNYQLTATFGGRFIHSGFDTSETTFFPVDSKSVTFYDLASTSLDPVETLDFKLVRDAADNGEIIAVAEVDDSIGYKISLIDVASRAVIQTSFMETDGILMELAFSPDHMELAALVSDSRANQIVLFVESAEDPQWLVDAVVPNERPVWELEWTLDSHYIAVELNSGRDYWVFDRANETEVIIAGTEIYADPASYPAALIDTLKAMNRKNIGYMIPAALAISTSGRYQARYLEYGIGIISLIDTAHLTSSPRQLAQVFLGEINDVYASEDKLSIDFSAGEMFCQIRVIVQYAEGQFNVQPLKHYLGCVHGHLGEILAAFYAASPTSDSFEGRFANASPHAIVLVRVDDGVLSTKPEDQLLLEGHRGRVVYSNVMDNNHFLTISEDQTARIWTIREGENGLELENVQIIELGIVPTGMLNYIGDQVLAIEGQADQLHLFNFKLDSPSFGEHLQTLPSVGAGFWRIVPTSRDVFYTLTSDNVIRRWEDTSG